MNNKCETCNLKAGNIGASIPLMPCGADRCVKHKKTNFEAITESPERLAKELEFGGCKWCGRNKKCPRGAGRFSNEYCKQGVVDWLKKEVEEE